MKKRSTITIVTIAIVFALLIVGVYCAITLDVGMSSSLTYEADGTFTEISAQIKQGPDLSELQNLAGDSYKMDKSLSQKGIITWSAPSVKLSLGKPVATYEFTIKNVGTEDITCYPAEDITTPTNVTCFEEVAELLRIAPETEKTGRLVFEYTGSEAVITEINPKVNFKMATTKSLEPTDSTLFTASSATGLKLNKTPTSSMLPDIRVLVVPDTVSGYTITGTYSTTSYSTAPFYKLSKDVRYVVLPSTLTALNNYAFYSGSATTGTCGGRFLKAINIPDNCSTFGTSLFYYNQNLNQVYLGQSIKQAKISMFYRCDNIRTIRFPATLTGTAYITSTYSTFNYDYHRYFEVDEANTVYSSYKGGLYNKDKSILYHGPGEKSVELYNGLTTISAYAFYNLINLQKVSIPSSLKTIGAQAFIDCTSLTTLTVPSGVSSISGNSFSRCSSLSITVDSSNSTYSSLNGSLYNKAKTSLLWHKYQSVVNDIPSTVVSIGERAFYNMSTLTTLTLPTGLQSIGTYAFYYCTSLNLSALPSGMTSIGSYAFQYCTSITSITLPTSSSFTNLNDNVFANCTQLSSITLPSNINTIGLRVFQNCTKLTLITINMNNVTTIYASSYSSSPFYNCSSSLKITVQGSASSFTKPSGWGTYWNYYSSSGTLSYTYQHI